MEISKPTLGIFYMAKIIGLAPYSIKKDQKGKTHIKRSIIFTIWSVILITTLVSLTYRGIFYDAHSNAPIRASFRMKSGTSKVVTQLDVSVVILVSSSGVLCGIIGLRSTQELNRRLHEIDEVLISCKNEKKDRIRAYILMIFVLIAICAMLGFDIWTWHKLEIEMKEVIHNTTKIEELFLQNVTVLAEAKNVHWYFPFYCMYIMLAGVHIHFAQTSFGIGRRYRRLNLILKRTFLKNEKSNNTGKIQPITITKNVTQTFDIFSSLKKSSSSLLVKDTSGSVINAKQIAIIDRLAYTHDSLGKAMKNITEAFGLTVLFILISCLLHLVATAYFLLLEFSGNIDPIFAWLQFFWILFHAMRLLLIVEPCHVTSTEAAQTICIICEIERTSTDDNLKENLRKFWQQLLSEKHNFSACGMCTIDRRILTSFASAIATYLVILIQFQTTNG